MTSTYYTTSSFIFISYIDDHVVVGHEILSDFGSESGGGEVGADADDSRS